MIPDKAAAVTVQPVTDAAGVTVAPHVQAIREQALEMLLARMPARPLAADTLARTGYDRAPDPMTALGHRYCQYNPRARLGVLSFDLDQQSALESVVDAALCYGQKLPLPNFETERRNGRHQAHLLLRDAVGRSMAHRSGPQRYLGNIRHRLAIAYQADPAASGHIMRGLHHTDQTTVIYHANLFTLAELDDLLPPLQSALLPATLTSGRNVTLFRLLDRFAAGLAADGIAPTSKTFTDAVEAEAGQLFTQVPQYTGNTYTRAELRRTVASVIKRTQTGANARYARTGGVVVPLAAYRCRTWSSNRPPPLHPDRASANMLAAAAPSNARRAEEAAQVYKKAALAILARGETVTAKAMAAETGRHIRQVKTHAATWKAAIQEAQQGKNSAQTACKRSE